MSEPNVAKDDFGYNSGEMMGYNSTGPLMISYEASSTIYFSNGLQWYIPKNLYKAPTNSSFTIETPKEFENYWIAIGTNTDLSCKGYSFRDDSNTGQAWIATGTFVDFSCKGCAIASITSYEPNNYTMNGEEVLKFDHKNKKLLFKWSIEAPNIATTTQIIQPINIIKNLQPSEIPNMKTEVLLFDWTFVVALMLGMFVRQAWKFIWKTYCIGKILSMRERK